MAIAKVSLNNLLLIAILASSSVNAASQDIKALQIKAGQGDIQASLELGKHFENAEGVEQNLGEALTYYRRAVLLGHSEEGSQRLTALRHRYGEIEKKAKSGDPKSEYDFGTILSADPDYENYYPRRSEPKAKDWFERAAEQGYRPAQRSLASIYAQMPLKNLEKSLYWFSIWAKSGDASSQLEVADILKEYPFMLMKNQLELRKEWLTLAANNGSAEAMLELGYFIRDNEGNDDAALTWYMKSANKGYARGQLAVGLSLIHKHDIQQAVKWLELAASNGNMSAQTALGQIYEEMEPLNQKRALFWYQKAAAQGDTYAAYRTGYYLHNGITVAKDNITAWSWCSLGIDATPDSRDERDAIEKELSASDLQKAKEIYAKEKAFYIAVSGN